MCSTRCEKRQHYSRVDHAVTTRCLKIAKHQNQGRDPLSSFELSSAACVACKVSLAINHLEQNIRLVVPVRTVRRGCRCAPLRTFRKLYFVFGTELLDPASVFWEAFVVTQTAVDDGHLGDDVLTCNGRRQTGIGNHRPLEHPGPSDGVLTCSSLTPLTGAGDGGMVVPVRKKPQEVQIWR